MSQHIELKLAALSDAESIGRMSRDLIEYGLPWSWNPSRVARHIRHADTLVLTAWRETRLVGFAIMQFYQDTAHLSLLAVDPGDRRLGIGRGLIEWLEQSARVAGTFFVSLEVRTQNREARVFYKKLGFTEIVSIPGYYCGREAAVRMIRDIGVKKT